MPPRKRAGASARLKTKRAPRKKPAASSAKKPRGRPRLAPYQSCTPEMEANIQRRYEETDEPIDAIAADRGVAPASLRRIAATKGWVRRKHRPAKDVTEAMRILAETERLETEVAPASLTPTDPLTPTLALPLSGGGSPTERGEGNIAPAAPSSPDLHLATIERLEAAVRKELGVVEAMRAAFGSEPYKPYHAQLTTRTLSNLTDTLGKLARLRAALAPQPVAPAPAGLPHDDYPADIDEFRREFARRLALFVASRTDGAGDGAAGAAGGCDPL
jgi:hypothetical protein